MKDKYIRIVGGGHTTHEGSTSAFICNTPAKITANVSDKSQ